jgi:hypothetical protein
MRKAQEYPSTIIMLLCLLSKDILEEPVLSAVFLAFNNMYICWGYQRKSSWTESEVKLFESKTVPDVILAAKKAFEGIDTSNCNYPKLHFLHHIGETIRRTGAPELGNSDHFENSHKRCVRAIFVVIDDCCTVSRMFYLNVVFGLHLG